MICQSMASLVLAAELTLRASGVVVPSRGHISHRIQHTPRRMLSYRESSNCGRAIHAFWRYLGVLLAVNHGAYSPNPISGLCPMTRGYISILCTAIILPSPSTEIQVADSLSIFA